MAEFITQSMLYCNSYSQERSIPQFQKISLRAPKAEGSVLSAHHSIVAIVSLFSSEFISCDDFRGIPGLALWYCNGIPVL